MNRSDKLQKLLELSNRYPHGDCFMRICEMWLKILAEQNEIVLNDYFYFLELEFNRVDNKWFG